MPPILRSTRIWFAVGAALVIAAALVAVAGSSLPGWVLFSEIGMFALGSLYAVVTVVWVRWLVRIGDLGSTATLVVNMALTTTILALAAPWIPQAMPLSFAILLSTVLAAILTRRPPTWSLPLIATFASLAALAIVWARIWPAADVRQFAIWAGLLAGLGVLVEVHRRLGRTEVDQRLRHLSVTAAAAHQLGAATDLSSIARAVLDAFQSAFPHLNWGGILRLREGRLEPLPVSLTPAGLAATAAPWTAAGGALRPGDGLAGTAFVKGDVQAWSTGREARQAALTSERLRTFLDAHVGPIRSGLAVPLRIGNTASATGVITLASTTAEHEWSDADLMLARGLADVAAVAIHRGELSEEQRRQASTDHLTGLPNRREFERVLAERSRRRRYSILLADVDNLKLINDEYGHEAGDGVLRIVGSVMRYVLRVPDTVARIGGDEFAALLPATDMATAAAVAERVVEAMQGVASPFGAARLSIGVADGEAGTPVREVWDRADAALYTAKQSGRNRARASVERTAPGSPAVRWGEVVTSVIEDRGLRSVYQPIVRLSDRAVVGYEALARRVDHPDERVDELFSAAHRLGFARDLDWLARRAALEGARDLPRGALLFINVGVLALVDPLHDIDQMFLLLNWVGRSPDEVVLELSEREAVTDRARLRAVLASYRYHGFRFAIDDVGEGHSTIEVLATARPEFIKVASTLSRSQGRAADGNLAAIAALVTFASATGAVVIAEGLESEDEIQLMADLGVTVGQGFGLGRPGPLTIPVDRPAGASGQVTSLAALMRSLPPAGH